MEYAQQLLDQLSQLLQLKIKNFFEFLSVDELTKVTLLYEKLRNVITKPESWPTPDMLIMVNLSFFTFFFLPFILFEIIIFVFDPLILFINIFYILLA